MSAHHRLLAGHLPLALRSESPTELRAWLRERGLAAALVVDRPPEDHGRFQAVGIAPLSRPGLPAAALVYRIDAGRWPW